VIDDLAESLCMILKNSVERVDQWKIDHKAPVQHGITLNTLTYRKSVQLD